MALLDGSTLQLTRLIGPYGELAEAAGAGWTGYESRGDAASARSPWPCNRSRVSVLLTGLVAFLPWVSEDRAEAQERTEGEKKQIAVDVWLVWCQRCLSMLNLVLDEPEGAKLSEDRVWLEVDFDRPENAGFFEKFPSGWREAEAAVMSARDEIAKLDRGS